MNSLQGRLGAGLAAALLLAFSLQYLLVSIAVRKLTEDYVLSRLARDTDNLLGALEFDADGIPRLVRTPEGRFDEGPYSGHYFQVQAGAVTLRSRSLWDQLLPADDLVPGTRVHERLRGPLDQPLLLLRSGFLKQQRPVYISVAEDLGTVDAGIRRFQLLYLGVSLAFLALLLASLRWIVRRSLMPLADARVELDKLTRGETDLLQEEVPAEMQPLVREINALLRLLARRLAQSRTLAGNLAHSLKTPLSLLLRLASDPELERFPQCAGQLREQVERMRLRIEQELNRARLSGDSRGGRRFNPARDLPPLIATLQQIHAARDPEIRLRIVDDAAWPADREDMIELCGNLADNACKWSRARVFITFGPGPSLYVEDDGPGAAFLATAAQPERGLRADENTPGHGLGLSIVRDTVEHYGGSIEFGRSAELGGLCVSVRLPGSATRA